MKKEKLIQADIEVRAEELLKSLLAYKHAVNGYHYGWDCDKDNPKKYIQADIKTLIPFISALEAMRDASKLLPERTTFRLADNEYPLTVKHHLHRELECKAFDIAISLCQPIVSKLLLKIKDIEKRRIIEQGGWEEVKKYQIQLAKALENKGANRKNNQKRIDIILKLEKENKELRKRLDNWIYELAYYTEDEVATPKGVKRFIEESLEKKQQEIEDLKLSMKSFVEHHEAECKDYEAKLSKKPKPLSRDNIFIEHIQSHLKEGQEVICKICGKSANAIVAEQERE